MVSCDAWNECELLKDHLKELASILPISTLPDNDMPKKEVFIEKITSGSASMVHFFGHGNSESRVSFPVPIIPFSLSLSLPP